MSRSLLPKSFTQRIGVIITTVAGSSRAELDFNSPHVDHLGGASTACPGRRCDGGACLGLRLGAKVARIRKQWHTGIAGRALLAQADEVMEAFVSGYVLERN
jgi:hypothetical protein